MYKKNQIEKEPGNVRLPKPEGGQVLKESSSNSTEGIGATSKLRIYELKDSREVVEVIRLQERPWSLPVWKYLKAIWTSLWATGSR